MSTYDLTKYEGVFVAMNSCYDEFGEVSPSAAKKLTRFLLDKGVSGLYVGGSTGEGLIQSVEERKRMLEAVMEEARGQAVVIAHIGAANTRDSVELARHAERAGADALSSVAPFYYRVSDKAVKQHWNAMIDSTELPFIIYHIPSTTGFHLSASVLQEMKQNPKVIGVKITTSSTYELQQFKAVGGDRFVVFNGPDEQYLAGRMMGANAGIGGTYGVMPELFVALERQIRAGKLEEALSLQVRINEIITRMLELPIYGALKELIKRRGIDCGGVRAPLEQVGGEHERQIDELYNRIMQAVGECGKLQLQG